MKWKFTTAQRIRTGAALLVVFLLILATNLIDRHHYQIVQKNLTSIYDNRLIAKSYLYQVSRYMQKKQLLHHEENSERSARMNRQYNDSIESLLLKYEKTELILRESDLLASLVEHIDDLFQYEEDNLEAALSSLDNSAQYYARIFKDLDALSQIQIGEGRRKVLVSNKQIESSDIIFKLEIGALIVIGILLQILIFVRPLRAKD